MYARGRRLYRACSRQPIVGLLFPKKNIFHCKNSQILDGLTTAQAVDPLVLLYVTLNIFLRSVGKHVLCTLLTIFICRASSAVIVRPVRSSSAATAGPTNSGRKCVPPIPESKKIIIEAPTEANREYSVVNLNSDSFEIGIR